MKQRYLFIIIILILLVSLGITVYNNLKTINLKIEKYEIKTYEYFNNGVETTQFYIDSIEELEIFYSLYSNELNIDKTKLQNYKIFIKVEAVSSGSIEMKLADVLLKENKLNFEIEKKEPEIGTSEMAFWYFVAMIPNQKVKELDISDWEKPSKINNRKQELFQLDSGNKFEIITDFRWRTMLDDGGSNTNIYYQIDLDNNIVKKVQEEYYANLGGTPTTNHEIIYTKKIGKELSEKSKLLLEKVFTKEDVNDENNYEFFTIRTFKKEKNIYSTNMITQINSLLKEIDEN